MATTIIGIAYDSTQTAATVADRLTRPAADAVPGCQRLGSELSAIAGGLRRAQVTMLVESSDTTKPSATITLDSTSNAIVADDTIQIGPVTLTWKASPASEDQVAFVNTTATDTDALAAAINAHTDLSGMVTASSDGASVVTVTGALPGNICRYYIARTETNAGSVTLSASSLGGITSAVQSTPRTYARGL